MLETPVHPSSADPEPDDGSCGPRAEPDPDRPEVALAFRLSDDLRSVTGTETVVFTPDLEVEEAILTDRAKWAPPAVKPCRTKPAIVGSSRLPSASHGKALEIAFIVRSS